jgi:hypothetical protein
MKFIPEVRRAWRFISVQAMSAAVALLGAWEVLPDDLKAGIPHSVVTWTAVVLLVLGIVGRLVQQPPKDKP